MEEISLNGGEGFQEASWGVGNVFKKFEEYTPLLCCIGVCLKILILSFVRQPYFLGEPNENKTLAALFT